MTKLQFAIIILWFNLIALYVTDSLFAEILHLIGATFFVLMTIYYLFKKNEKTKSN
jgi:hypothetical protein